MQLSKALRTCITSRKNRTVKNEELKDMAKIKGPQWATWQRKGQPERERRETKGNMASPLANAESKSRGMRACVPGFKCRLEMPDTERVQRFNQTAYNAGKFHRKGM